MRPRAAALAILFALLACARGVPRPETPPAPEVVEPAQGAPAPVQPLPAEPEEPRDAAPPTIAGSPEPPLRIPERVRVGLATDRPEVRVPCCAPRLALATASKRLELRAEARIEPGGRVAAAPVYRLQAAALRAETQAVALARSLETLVGTPGEVVFDAGEGLYRVRLGRFGSRAEAESAILALRRRGFDGAWVVSEPARLEDPALVIIHGERRWSVRGRWLAIVAPEGASAIPFEGKRYRGELLVYLNDRGSLNLVNRVSLDDYLRGVVPREMGPEIYDDLDALKAQAVAARTYTLRNLGEFRDEGYDICATPRCQVYGGIASEHALSDRAVRETSGEVLMARDHLAETLYSSTCGGHTEDVAVVFPSKSHSYLRGVPCLESGPVRLAGEAGAGLVETAVLDRLLPVTATDDLAVFVDRSRLLAAMAGLDPAVEPPVSRDRRRIHDYLARLLALDPDGGMAKAAGPAPVAEAAGWSSPELRLAARLHEAGLMESRRSASVDGAELRRVLFRLAIYLRQLERIDGRFLGLEDGRLRIKRRLSERSWLVENDVATFGAAGGALRPAALTLAAGDPVSVYTSGNRLLVLAQRRELRDGRFEPPTRGRAWQHFRTDRDLEKMVNGRYPGLGFRHLEIVSRGVSGRVGTLRLTGGAGEQIDVEGLPIRWVLDLPDTLFTAERTVSRGGEKGWLFSGRGWGHGVGMCQVGAFGMARRGHGYTDILDHYYTGLELTKLAPHPETTPAS